MRDFKLRQFGKELLRHTVQLVAKIGSFIGKWLKDIWTSKASNTQTAAILVVVAVTVVVFPSVYTALGMLLITATLLAEAVPEEPNATTDGNSGVGTAGAPAGSTC